MVEHQEQLDQVFRALGDPTRRAMVQRLAGGHRSVTELARPFAMSLAAASKHVKVLEEAGLVRRTIEGRIHHCRLDPRPLGEAMSWLRRYADFWDERLTALETVLKECESNERD
jgi:DNA-binding transcriptional ArsR family regulator